MLRPWSFVIGLAILLSIASCSANVARVSYIPESIPSCVITEGDGYWKWRDSLSASPQLEQDLNTVYEIFRRRLLTTNASEKEAHFREDLYQHSRFIKAMCTKEILYSAELTRVMNHYGSNVTPSNFLSAMNTMVVEGYFDKGDYDVPSDLFRRIVDAVLVELESRFN